jgi:hypothetical protein
MRILNHEYRLEPVTTLEPHPRNPNRGKVAAIEESIAVNGFYGVIVAQVATRRIIAGEHRWRAAIAQGATQVPVIWLDVPDPVAVKLMLADNRLARLGDDDPATLLALLQDLERDGDLSGTGFAHEDLNALLADLDTDLEPPPDDKPLETALAQLRERWGVQRGQVWAIPSDTVPGRSHRILCGDSTDAGNHARVLERTKPALIFADPPYGISIVKASGKIGSGKAYKPVHGDEDTGIAERAARLCLERYPKALQVWWGGNYYAHVLPPSSCWLVWDKDNGDTSFADAELAWTNHTGAVRLFQHTWSGFNTASEDASDRIHPTQKPVALAAWVLERFASKGDTVFDPFLGSGISVLAAEHAGCLGYGIEYEPEYIAGTLERLKDLGLEPHLHA